MFLLIALLVLKIYNFNVAKKNEYIKSAYSFPKLKCNFGWDYIYQVLS